MAELVDFLDYIESKYFESKYLDEQDVMDFVDFTRDIIHQKKIKTLVVAEEGKEVFLLGITKEDPILKPLNTNKRK